MKLSGWVSTGVLSLLIGASTAVFAQDKPDDVKPPQQEEPKQDETKPRKDEAKAPRQDEAKPPKREEQDARDQVKPEERPERQADDHSRPAGRGERIPDDKFRAHFGREHTVVINRPVIVEGQPRFQSGGYWFIISEPWPAGWEYTDQCYIDDVDGEYFLFDLLHPGVRVALVVTL